jgi:hypothetical protein
VNEERRSETPVRDAKADSGILIGNILSAAILASILWVGSTLISLREEVRVLVNNQQMHGQQLSDHEQRLRQIERLTK